MSRKKVFLLLISLVFMMGLFANAVPAQEDEGGLASAFETIRQLFGFLPEIITLEKLVGGDAAAVFWAKFFIWVLLFAVTYFGAGFVFKDNKNIATVVAIVISIISAVLIPNTIVTSIFQTYGLVAAILLWIVPLLAAVVVARKFDNKFIKAAIYWVAVWILFSINATLVSNTEFGMTFQYFGLLLFIAFIMALWNTIGAFGGIGAQEGAKGWVGDKAKGLWDWVKGSKTPPKEVRKEEKKEEKEEKKEEKMDMAELYEERKISKKLSKLITKVKDTLSTPSVKAMVSKEFPDLWKRMRILYGLEVQELNLERRSEKEKEKLSRYIPGSKGKFKELNEIMRKEKTIFSAMVRCERELSRIIKEENTTKIGVIKYLEYIKKCVDLLIRINLKEIRDLKEETKSTIKAEKKS